MCDCSRCKFCEKDYYYNDELEDEFPIYTCEKGNDTDLDFQCKDFEEYKPKPYMEKDTECDKCEYLSECKSKGNYIDCTTVDDKRSHVVCSRENCKKLDAEKELPWVEVGNWKPIEAKEIGKPQEKIEVANFESDYRKNAVYLEDDCK